jgi:hypothetical protein
VGCDGVTERQLTCNLLAILGQLRFEVVQILDVLRVVFRLFVFLEFRVEFVLRCRSFILVHLLLFRIEDLPSLPNKLGNLREGKILPFELVPHTWNTVNQASL